MNLPTLSVPETADEAIDLYKERFHSTDRRDLPLVASIQLMAYLAWPNDEARRNSWAAATVARQATLKGPVSIDSIPVIDMFGGLAAISDAAFDKLTDELTEVMKGWPPVADVMSRLVDMTYDGRVKLRGGPSIAKAVDLSNFEPEGRSRAQINRLWSRFHDVAHLIAAGAFLAESGTHPRSRSIFAAVWFAPDAVAGVAAGFEGFGLTTIPHGQPDSLLPAATTWRLPVGFRPKQTFLVPRKLSQAQIDYLSERRSPKPYQPKP
jgi:hypothetical protein